MFPWRSLKARVALFTLVLFLIGVWSIAIYAGRILRNSVQDQLGEHQFSTVSSLAAQVNDSLESRVQGLTIVAASLARAMRDNQSTVQVSLEQRPLLLTLFNAGVIVLAADGTAIAGIPQASGRVGVNYMDRDYIAAALKDGKSGIGPPVKGKMLPHPLITLVVPILDDQGKVIGALAGVTDLSKPNFLDRITENQYGQTGGYFVVARQQRLIIAASDKSRVMETLPAPGLSPILFI